jgi:succinyl-CoA synthetase beta subunit
LLQDSAGTEGVVTEFIRQFFQFFRQYGFTSLEVNPFAQTADGAICCLDMVAKVDSCEAWRQKERVRYIGRVKPFGTRLHPSEALVESVDEKTGASLKLTVINPEGRLWFLL